jgi:hypothetical protein
MRETQPPGAQHEPRTMSWLTVRLESPMPLFEAPRRMKVVLRWPG